MRDYPQFPEVIPHRRADYSRVTQPSAALSIVAEATITLDLHALSAPPAFTLSQDQTLLMRNLTSFHYSAVKEPSLPVAEGLNGQ